MRALILAAGDGDRLRPHTDDRPKSLLPVGGRPILNHVLDSLFAAGMREVVIVAGFRAQQIHDAIANLSPCGMSVRVIENAEYHLGNARSLWCAKDHVAAPFVLAMADHLVEPALTRALVSGATDRNRLAIDRMAADDPRADDATRALVRDGRVVDLGKQIKEWNAVDTGTFWCSQHVLDVLTDENSSGELGAIFAGLARSGELDAVDVTGCKWIDIDQQEDLRRAQVMLASGWAREADGSIA